MNPHRKWKTWYQDATANRRPLPYNVTIRFGSAWLNYRPAYVRMLKEQQSAFTKLWNWKAARVLRYHRQLLPQTLPYTLHVSGFEWPVLAHAMLRAMQTDDEVYRKTLQNLYQRLIKARGEAKHEYDERRAGENDRRGSHDADVSRR